MSLAKGIVAALEADATTNAIANGRYWRKGLPQEPVYPAVLFVRQGKKKDQTLDGCGGIAYVDIDLQCLAKTGSEADDLSAAVQGVLDNKLKATFGTVDVMLSELTDEQDDLFVEGDLRIHIKALTFQFVLRE